MNFRFKIEKNNNYSLNKNTNTNTFLNSNNNLNDIQLQNENPINKILIQTEIQRIYTKVFEDYKNNLKSKNNSNIDNKNIHLETNLTEKANEKVVEKVEEATKEVEEKVEEKNEEKNEKVEEKVEEEKEIILENNYYTDENIELLIEDLPVEKVVIEEEDQWEYQGSEKSDSSLSDTEVINEIYKNSNLVEIIIQDKVL